MRNKTLLVILFLGVFAVFTNVNAQASIITIHKPFVAKSLSGTVTNQLGEIMPNVSIRRVRKGWSDEIQYTKTNAKGKFSFKNLPEGLYYLRFETIDFNPLEIKIRLKRNSKAKLKFVLEIAT